ncbi:MAG: ATP-binding protein, partial [Candidatus Marinimicrobia bacterium]|nr:ATP-binding protein [Candidatus Jacksonbacteria bacterium]MBT6937664.1 ATP-binding protein [Candidatus Neomarinimicrobiota bacterium]
MALKNWWQVCTPHNDILEGRFDQSVFAADLGDVIIGRGPRDYQDATLFFEKTYVTAGLKELISTIVAHISGDAKGQSVIQLQTSFGGGKTHS